jgi:adenylate cyclase
MAKHLEIERKFLVKHLPNARRAKASRIVQGYFATTKGIEIRLREEDSQHFLTVKAGHGRSRQEEEIEISKSKFRSLWPLTQEARISKTRYRVPYSGRTIEMDVYHGPHRGLVTAEIEFDSLRESRGFEGPEWLGREITGDGQYANATLARRHRVPRPSQH